MAREGDAELIIEAQFWKFDLVFEVTFSSIIESPRIQGKFSNTELVLRSGENRKTTLATSTVFLVRLVPCV